MSQEFKLTNSEMKTWMRCKRKWYFGTYRGLARRVQDDFNRPASIGTRVHDALSFYYQPGVDRCPEDAMQFFREGVEADKEAHPVRVKEIGKEAALAEAMLEGYFEWLEETGEDADLKVIAPESEVEVGLVPGVSLLSKIDARVEKISDGARGALEHKTVGSVTEPLRRLQTDPQLLTEHLVEYLQLVDAGDTENRAKFVLYNMLRKVKRTVAAKPPFFAREPVTHSETELRSHWRHCARIAKEISAMRTELDAGAHHHDTCPPNNTRDCTWDCPFSDMCLSGMVDDGSDYEQYLADEFVVGDPLERYRKSVGLPARDADGAVVGSTA